MDKLNSEKGMHWISRELMAYKENNLIKDEVLDPSEHEEFIQFLINKALAS